MRREIMARYDKPGCDAPAEFYVQLAGTFCLSGVQRYFDVPEKDCYLVISDLKPSHQQYYEIKRNVIFYYMTDMRGRANISPWAPALNNYMWREFRKKHLYMWVEYE